MNDLDFYLEALERQAAAIDSARLELEDSKAADWRVEEAEFALSRLLRRYYELLSESPTIVVRFHVKHPHGI